MDRAGPSGPTRREVMSCAIRPGIMRRGISAESCPGATIGMPLPAPSCGRQGRRAKANGQRSSPWCSVGAPARRLSTGAGRASSEGKVGSRGPPPPRGAGGRGAPRAPPDRGGRAVRLAARRRAELVGSGGPPHSTGRFSRGLGEQARANISRAPMAKPRAKPHQGCRAGRAGAVAGTRHEGAGQERRGRGTYGGEARPAAGAGREEALHFRARGGRQQHERQVQGPADGRVAKLLDPGSFQELDKSWRHHLQSKCKRKRPWGGGRCGLGRRHGTDRTARARGVFSQGLQHGLRAAVGEGDGREDGQRSWKHGPTRSADR